MGRAMMFWMGKFLEVVRFWDEISLGGAFLDGDACCHCSKGQVQRAASNGICLHGESHLLLFRLILIG